MTRNALVMLGLLGACGGGGHKADGGSFDGSASAGDLASMVDLSTPPDLAPLYRAWLSVNLLPSSGDQIVLNVLPYTAACERSYIGPCEVISCPDGTLDGYQPGSPVDESGDVTLTQGGNMTTVTPSYNGAYGTATATLTGLSAAPITVDVAAGSVIPAFTGTITMPGPISGTNAAVASGTVPRNQDLTFAFEGGTGTAPAVYVLQQVNTMVTTGASALCVFEAGATSGTVPAAALAAIPAGPALVELLGIDRTSTTSGDFDLRVRGLNSTPAGDGGSNTKHVTLD